MIYKAIISLCLLLIATSCLSSNVNLSSPLPKNAVKLKHGLLTSSSSINSEAYTVYENGIKYVISVDKNKEINYISTMDKNFMSPEGIRVGNSLQQVLNVADSKNINKEFGWAFFVKLPSGWSVAFTQGKTVTEGKLKNIAEVKWLFKRK